jgi:tetratricopeptide (TPR) repeat protein
VLLFGKKKSADESEGQDAGNGETGPQPDPKKARKWFEHARSVADTRNYDYAIECYVNGLLYSPDAMDEHEALHDVAVRRRASGAKGKGKRSPTAGGKSHVERMLAAEYQWAFDLSSASNALKVMEEAVAVNLTEVAYWIGEHAIEANRSAKRPSKYIYTRVRDLYVELQSYEKAVEACSLAVQLDPNNAELIRALRNLQAEATMDRGRYASEGGFRESVRDMDKQRAVEQDEQIAASDDVIDQQIARARAEYENAPEETDRISKYVRALLQKEDKEQEDQAIDVLQKAYDNSGQYRYKMQIGDIRMKQFNRALRELRKQREQDPDNQQIKDKYDRLAVAQAKFELEEYQQRCKNYPTDMPLRFQLGRRQLALGMNDEAIASFQEAQSDPKHRAPSLRYLGEAFAKKGWYDEAVDTFRRGIDAHEQSNDRTALELRYNLMDALEQKARAESNLELAQEANRIGSQVAQTDINFRDIRQRIESLRQLIEELRNS